MQSVPLIELSALAEDIHVKASESSQNINLDMQEFLEIGKNFQFKQGEVVNDNEN